MNQYVRNLALLLFTLTVILQGNAQTICGPNLVPNHDFELNDPVLCGSSINGIGQLWIDTSQVTSWMGTSLKNGSGNGITPDHYNNTCTGNSGATCMQGNASVGVFTSTNAGSGTSNVREYVQGELISPLTAGSTYYIQMTVSSGSGGSWAHTDGFGAWLRQDTGPIDIGNNGGIPWIPATPQFENQTGNIIDVNCQVISGYFCADGGENWIMLGNFKEDFQMTVGTTGNSAGSASYVIMDEIFIQEVCPGANPDLINLIADQNPLSCGQSVTIEGLLMTTSYGTINYNWLEPSTLVGNPSLGPHTEQLTQNTNYVLEYTAAGACGNFTDTVSLSIDVNSGVNVNLNALVDETCLGDCDGSIDVSLSGGTAPYTTNWYNSGGGSIGTTNNITALCSDEYTIEVTTTESIQQTDIIFTEDFESGSATGWTLNTNPTAGTNGPNNNLWEVTNQNIGSSTGSCTPSADFTLNLVCPGGCGSDQYDNFNTAIMAETPMINTTGYSNLNLTFDFLGEENGTHCNGALYYNDGGGWTYIQDLLSATCWGPYNGWQGISIPLPAALNNIPNAQIGFHWYNDTYIITEDWGLAVNNIMITAEIPVDIVCTEIDTFQITGVTCGCVPPTLTTVALNGCTPDSVDMSTGVTTAHGNGTPNVSYYTSQTDADNSTNAVSNWATTAGTYYVRSEDPLNAGCYITEIITITFGVGPNPGASGAITLCTTDASVDLFTLLGGGPDASGTWAPAMTSGTGVFDPSQDAGATYTYTVTNGCGSLSADVVVTVTSNPDPGTNGTVTFCANDPSADLFSSLNGSPDAGGTWAPAMTSGTGVFDPSQDAAGTYTYTLNACGGGTLTADVVVTVNPLPIAGTNGATTLCSTDPSVDLFTLLGGSPDAGGTWAPAMTSGTGVFDPAQDAGGVYTYTVTNSCGSASADVTVTVTNNPNPGTNGTVTFCSSDAAADLFGSLNGTPDAGGTWTPALTSGTGLFDPAQDAAGTYTYTLNACGGGTLTADVVVTLNPAPVAGTNGATTLCTTDPSVDLFTLLGGSPDAGGTWAPAMTSGTGAFDPAQDPGATYTYTVTNSCGSVSADVVVTVTNNPSPGTNGAVTFCDNDPSADLFGSLNGTPDIGGSWTPALTSGTGVFDPTQDLAGTYTYTLNACGGGTLTADVVVTINPAPIAGTNGTTTLCATDPSVDLFTLLGGTPDAGGTWAPAMTSGTGTFNPAQDAGGTYTYTVTNSCGSTSATVDVTLTSSMDPGTNGTITLCSADPATDLFNSLNGTPDAGGTWTPALTSGTGQFDPTQDAAGTYTYTVAVCGGGTATADVVVTINPSPQAGADGTVTLCSNDPASDLFNSLVGTADAGGTWAPALTSGTGSFDPQLDVAGVYTYTVTNPCGSASATVTVTIDNCNPPVADFTLNFNSICFGECIDLTDISSGGPTSWAWDFGGAATPNTSTAQHPTICPDSVGTFTISLTATNGFGSNTITQVVQVNPIPTVDAGVDQTVDMGVIVDLNAIGNPAGGTYEWQNPTVECPSCSFTTASPILTTTYTVVYTTAEGCEAQDEVTINILFEDVIDVPNGFSPNSDGMNDVLFVEGQGVVNMTFVIYNRYGQKVFESNSQNLGWDGTLNGMPENPGVFAWYLSYSLVDGSSANKKGNVTLIK